MFWEGLEGTSHRSVPHDMASRSPTHIAPAELVKAMQTRTWSP
jgi:hypothetical protein